MISDGVGIVAGIGADRRAAADRNGRVDPDLGHGERRALGAGVCQGAVGECVDLERDSSSRSTQRRRTRKAAKCRRRWTQWSRTRAPSTTTIGHGRIVCVRTVAGGWHRPGRRRDGRGRNRAQAGGGNVVVWKMISAFGTATITEASKNASQMDGEMPDIRRWRRR